MRLLIFGPQAAGKGTQAELLAKELGITHISTGELLREEVRAETGIGQEIKELMDKGDLITERITNQLTKEAVDKAPEGFILDGYPRSKTQSEFLDTITPIDKVILIEVPDKTSIERISGRRECPKGHDYHIKYKTPKEEGICDVDGLPLVPRSDDTEEATKHRLDIYHNETEPVFEHYKDKILKVNGEQEIEKVYQDIIAALHR
ncbi:nucleoside monophosphate kinase [Candidatus Woesearchaeota archaeon]|nr:nucleoside monophosphate kinase [Candidatus Woesearchaeota archaeon]